MGDRAAEAADAELEKDQQDLERRMRGGGRRGRMLDVGVVQAPSIPWLASDVRTHQGKDIAIW